MGLIRLVREHTDFPIHKHAAHVIRKVDRHPVTGKWRAEGWKTGEQLRFRHQIRRVLGSRVDINRLFERLEPKRWRGDDIADAFWTFFLRNVHGADAFPDVVNVKQELLVKKTNNTSSSTSPRGTEPYALNDAFFHRRGLTRDDFVNALARCVARPDETFPEWLRLAGWNDVCEGDRDPSEYELPPAPSRAISAPRRTHSTVQVPDKINKKRKRAQSLGPSASDASEATDATCGHVRGAELENIEKNAIGSLADDVDARGDAHGTHTALRTTHRRRRRPAPTELILPNIKEEGNDEFETSRDDGYESTFARIDFVAAASTLAAATQLGDFNAVAAALRTLIAAAPNVAPNVNDDDDGALTSLASDVFAEYNRDLMTDDADDVTESVFDDEASVFEEDGVLNSRVRILEAPNLECAGIERLDSIPEDAAPDLLEDLLAASL
jgi:hypothetical protein